MIKFIGSFETVKSLPRTQFPEYAFIGRSNVGKSSLVNAIAGSVIARTSKTPGRTQSLNLFNWGDRLALMDLPGYGYAKISKADTERWLARLEEYLLTRGQLKLLFILIDSRHELKKSDLEIMDFCDKNGIPYQVVLTKIDKSNKSNIAKLKAELWGFPPTQELLDDKSSSNSIPPHKGAGKRPAACTQILETSAEKKIGIEEIRKIIGCK